MNTQRQALITLYFYTLLTKIEHPIVVTIKHFGKRKKKNVVSIREFA